MLVEVKRSSDTSARREVVAQMLDYVANGSAYWDVPDPSDPAYRPKPEAKNAYRHVKRQEARDAAGFDAALEGEDLHAAGEV